MSWGGRGTPRPFSDIAPSPRSPLFPITPYDNDASLKCIMQLLHSLPCSLPPPRNISSSCWRPVPRTWQGPPERLEGHSRAGRGRAGQRLPEKESQVPREAWGQLWVGSQPRRQARFPPPQGHPAALREGQGSKVSSQEGLFLGGRWVLAPGMCFPWGTGSAPVVSPRPMALVPRLLSGW